MTTLATVKTTRAIVMFRRWRVMLSMASVALRCSRPIHLLKQEPEADGAEVFALVAEAFNNALVAGVGDP